MNHIQIDHNSDEWLELRAGRLTSSSVPTIIANYPKAFGEPALKLASEIAVEQITGSPLPSQLYGNWLARGHEFEPVAVERFQEQYFFTLVDGGFFFDDLQGSSPDRLEKNHEFLAEIKTKSAHEFFKIKKSGKIPTNYLWQICHQMIMSEIDKAKFIAICPELPYEKSLLVIDTDAKEQAEKIEQVKKRTVEFFKKVDEAREVLNGF